jgi:hypothetical protein
MARARGFNNRFNAGELSQEAWCDSDLQQHAHGCALARNFIGLVPGPLARRAGTWDLGPAQSNAYRSRLVPFKRTADQALMLEFGQNTVRVFEADGTLVTEFPSPYGEGQLDGLRYTQPPGDVMVLTHVDSMVRTQVLTRAAATSWSFADYEFRNGPWRTENLTATTITPTGTVTLGGAITLTASAGIFEPGHEGALFRLRANDGGQPTVVPSWVADTDFDEVLHTQCISNGRIYTYGAVPAGHPTKFGTNAPIHESGVVNDSHIPWTYAHDGAGVVRITEYHSATVVIGVVEAALPIAAATATKYWSEGAFSDYRGWPTAAPAIHDERLMFAATAAEPDTLDATRLAGYTPTYADFKPGLGTGRVVDDDAIRRLAGRDAARIVWLCSATYLLAATTSAEVLITGANTEDGLSPTSYRARDIADYGAADVMPVKAHTTVLYVAANARTLRGISVAPDQTLAPEDLSVVAGDICGRGLAELAWTKQPDNICWARLSDGGFAAFLYHAEQGVKGWYSQALGAGDWTVESVAVIPGYGNRDALWLAVSRTKSGVTQRRLLMMSDRAEAMRLDAAELYEGAAVGAVTGLDHLAGETCLAMVSSDGGASYAQYTVTVSAGGVATLPVGVTGTWIVVGLAYTSRFESLPLDLSGPGSVQGRKQRLTQGEVTLKGVNFRGGVTEREDGDSAADVMETVHVTRATGETYALVPKRAVKPINFGGTSSRDPRVVITCAHGYDLEIHALMPTSDVHG